MEGRRLALSQPRCFLSAGISIIWAQTLANYIPWSTMVDSGCRIGQTQMVFLACVWFAIFNWAAIVWGWTRSRNWGGGDFSLSLSLEATVATGQGPLLSLKNFFWPSEPFKALPSLEDARDQNHYRWAAEEYELQRRARETVITFQFLLGQLQSDSLLMALQTIPAWTIPLLSPHCFSPYQFNSKWQTFIGYFLTSKTGIDQGLWTIQTGVNLSLVIHECM